MTKFEKQVIGLVETLIAATNCGGIHKGNWRLPCPRCVEKERKIGELLLSAIQDESIRRHLLANDDDRDGNKPINRVI